MVRELGGQGFLHHLCKTPQRPVNPAHQVADRVSAPTGLNLHVIGNNSMGERGGQGKGKGKKSPQTKRKCFNTSVFNFILCAVLLARFLLSQWWRIKVQEEGRLAWDGGSCEADSASGYRLRGCRVAGEHTRRRCVMHSPHLAVFWCAAASRFMLPCVVEMGAVLRL